MPDDLTFVPGAERVGRGGVIIGNTYTLLSLNCFPSSGVSSTDLAITGPLGSRAVGGGAAGKSV